MMKKLFLAVCLVVIMVFTTTPAWSLGIDSLLATKYLHPHSDAEAKQFFADVLGYSSVNDMLAVYSYMRIDDLTGKEHFSYTPDPIFSWDYALVKVDGPNDFSYLYKDDNGTGDVANGDNILKTGRTFPYDVSNISFLKPVGVPEPATMLLLGGGLLGLTIVSRKRLKK